MGGGSSGKTPGGGGDMTDTTVIKVDAAHSPNGPDGQTYLASGKTVSMRMWRDGPPNEHKRPVRRDYETVGYVVSGRAELTVEGQTVRLEPGSSWVVPKGAEHSYRILEALTAIEATAPPAQVHARDEDRG
jgi:mannose-6-phosphate isomerase-like protein (cupin superfamily)